MVTLTPELGWKELLQVDHAFRAQDMIVIFSIVGPALVDTNTIIIRDVAAINTVFSTALRPTAVISGGFLKQEDRTVIDLKFM